MESDLLLQTYGQGCGVKGREFRCILYEKKQTPSLKPMANAAKAGLLMANIDDPLAESERQ